MELAENFQNDKNKVHALEVKIISLTSELDLYQKRCEQYRQAYDISNIK